jgi:hypothetical protein
MLPAGLLDPAKSRFHAFLGMTLKSRILESPSVAPTFFAHPDCGVAKMLVVAGRI